MNIFNRLVSIFKNKKIDERYTYPNVLCGAYCYDKKYCSKSLCINRIIPDKIMIQKMKLKCCNFIEFKN